MPPATAAQLINAEHDAAHGDARAALERARKCGELLAQAKAEIAHGDWLPWIEESLNFGARQAQKYIKIAESWDRLQNANPNSHLLTIDKAFQVLAEPQALRHGKRNVRSNLGDLVRAQNTLRIASDRLRRASTTCTSFGLTPKQYEATRKLIVAALEDFDKLAPKEVPA